MKRCLPIVAVVFWAGAAHAGEPASTIKSDERVVLFSTDAAMSEDGKEWVVPIHGWLFEPEEDSLRRNALIAQIREWAEIDAATEQGEVFRARLATFLVDNERDKRVAVMLGLTGYVAPPSDLDGHFLGEVRIPAAEIAPRATGKTLAVNAILSNGDGRKFGGTVQLVPPEGISVISDIDDTVKISNVRDKKALTRSTFIEHFQPVPGMAEVYSEWAAKGVVFHFVSNGPWQLYEPLKKMLDDERFPPASLYLQRFRLKDSSALNLLADPMDSKPPVIEKLLERYPRRRFILIGDSGEKDPEVYGSLARKHPKQVVAIYIRDVTQEKADSPRYKEAFREIPADRWTIFTDAGTLKLPAIP